MAFTAIAAVAAAETVTVGLVLAAAAEVGTIMTVIGGVTGSKDLMKIGGTLGLVGGVGSMISKGLSTAAASSVAGEVGSSAIKMGAEAASDAALSSSMGALESGLNPGIIEGAQQAVGPDLASASMPDLSSTLNPTDMRLDAGTQATPGMMEVGPAQASAGSPTVNDVSGAEGPAGAQSPTTPMDVNPTDTRLAAGTQSSPFAPQDSGGFWSSFSKFAEKNKTLFNSGLQLVGGALKGANDRDMWNQKMDIERQRLAQTGRGNSVANFSPRTGIIGGARA